MTIVRGTLPPMSSIWRTINERETGAACVIGVCAAASPLGLLLDICAILLAVYAVVVVIVLALIIVNTSVLKNIDTETAAYEAQLSQSIARAEQLAEDIEAATSDETITEWGINNGMYFAD